VSKTKNEEEELWSRAVRQKSPDHEFGSFSSDDAMLDFYDIIRSLSKRTRNVRKATLEERVEALEREMQKIRQKSAIARKPNKVDTVYEMFREELEEKYAGKIVAIDIDSKKIVGVGDNIFSAYRDARRNSDKPKFSYKRVGSPYVYRLR
jgi:hypothetical protein